MSQTLTNEVTETKSTNFRLSVSGEDLHVMNIMHNDRVQRLLEISWSVTLQKIMDAVGSANVSDLVKILHLEVFCAALFSAMLQWSLEFQLITYDVEKKNRNE